MLEYLKRFGTAVLFLGAIFVVVAVLALLPAWLSVAVIFLGGAAILAGVM